MAREPDSELASRILPAPLRRALVHVFAQGISDCMLVGGTALAGYYAGHRRSDDLDLFTRNSPAQTAAVLAAQSLREVGATLEELQRTAQFYSATATLEAQAFTVQIVLDANLFLVGGAQRAGDGVWVADLSTLLKLKAATLVSRCSEKDLYDLRWLLAQFPDLDLRGLVQFGAEIDRGMTPEAVLTSLAGTTLKRSACDFSYTEAGQLVFREVNALKEGLARAMDRLARDQPVPEIGDLIRTLRR